MLTQAQAAAIRERIRQEQKWARARGYTRKDGWTVFPADVERPYKVTNEERSQLEVYEFVTDPPDKYVLYINEKTCQATTWPGDYLGDVQFGSPYRSNMGDTRVPVTIRAINGHTYYGTYYKSSGNYARVKRSKK